MAYFRFAYSDNPLSEFFTHEAILAKPQTVPVLGVGLLTKLISAQ